MATQPIHPISFGEFGVRFVHAALTAERIEAKFRERIGPIPEMTVDTGVPLTVGYVAAALTDVSVEELTPSDTDPDAAYLVHLGLGLHLRIEAAGVINANYDATFSVPCKLKVLAVTPLALQLTPYFIAAEDVGMNLQGTDLFANLIDGNVRGVLAGKVAMAVNTKMGEAQADMKIDLLKILADSDKPADPGATPPDGAVVKPISFDIANPVPLEPGDGFRGEVPANSHVYFKVVVDPKIQFAIETGVRVHENGPWTDLSWKLVDFDENLLATSASETAFDKENYTKLHWTLHSGERHEAALLVLKTAAADATVRGKLLFEPFAG